MFTYKVARRRQSFQFSLAVCLVAGSLAPLSTLWRFSKSAFGAKRVCRLACAAVSWGILRTDRHAASLPLIISRSVYANECLLPLVGPHVVLCVCVHLFRFRPTNENPSIPSSHPNKSLAKYNHAIIALLHTYLHTYIHASSRPTNTQPTASSKETSHCLLTFQTRLVRKVPTEKIINKKHELHMRRSSLVIFPEW